MSSPLEHDDFAGKGAVEQDSPGQHHNIGFNGQLPHRTENRLVKANDTDYPEPGGNPEHSGELMAEDKDRIQQNPDQQRQQVDRDAEGLLEDQDPGHRQKQNQNEQKDDPLAA